MSTAPLAHGFERLLRGSSAAAEGLAASLGEGLVIQRRTAPASERQEQTLDSHYILLWRAPMLADQALRRGRFIRIAKPRGSLSLGPAGPLPVVRPHAAYDVIACLIEAGSAARIAAEVGQRDSTGLHEHLAVRDASLAALLESAVQEVEAGSPSGRLYADSLAYVITRQYLRIGSPEPASSSAGGAMPARRLRTVLERMRDELDRDLSLPELAAGAGFSRAHFLRLFKAATGLTPHRYLQELRLQAAREKLASPRALITQVALDCGFSSHSHFTQAFRERFGLTPREYRRSPQHSGARMILP